MERELEDWAKGLIELGEFVLAHEELFREQPTSWQNQANQPGDITTPDPLTVNVNCRDAQELARRLLLFGTAEKYSETTEYYSSVGAKREFGPHTVDVYASSAAVCTPKRREPRVTKVVKLTDEAKAEIEAIRAAHTVTETTEVVVEWECPPSLLSPADEASS